MNETQGTHHHFPTRKEMKREMKQNFNAYDTFSYGVLLPKPTGVYLYFLRNYQERIESLVFEQLEISRKT